MISAIPDSFFGGYGIMVGVYGSWHARVKNN